MGEGLPTVQDICQPRKDVIEGSSAMDIYAADLSRVVLGDAPDISSGRS